MQRQIIWSQVIGKGFILVIYSHNPQIFNKLIYDYVFSNFANEW